MKTDIHKRFFFNICKFVYENDSIKGKQRSICFTIDLLLFMFHYGGGWKSNSIKIRFFIFDITLFQGYSFGNKIRVVRYDFDPYHISLQFARFNYACHLGFGFSKSVFMDLKINYMLWKATPEQRREWRDTINEVLGDKNK